MLDAWLRWWELHCEATRGTHVHDTGVDVTELLESEETGSVGRVIEDEGLSWRVSSFAFLAPMNRWSYGSGVDRNSARVGRGINLLSVW
jgi:hypothetical protein